MTEANGSARPQSKITYTAICCMVFFIFALFLRSPQIAAEYTERGLLLCAKTVIPSLFPFMVISEIIVSSGIGDTVGKPFGRFTRKVFGISGPSACAVILGALCGFPIGAKTAVSLYDRGSIDRRELSRLLTFCNLAGAAFLISTVGVSIWSSATFGIGLYCVQLIAAVLIGAWGKQRDNADAVHFPCAKRRNEISFSIFTRAAAASANGMLVICAYVAFFSALVGSLGEVISPVIPSKSVTAFFYALFEISSGVSYAAAADSVFVGALLSAFAVGWSGLSVHFQIMSICDGRGVSFFPYLRAKAAQAILCVVMTAIWFSVCPPKHMSPAARPTVFSPLPVPYLYAVHLLFAASLVVSAVLFCRKR